MLRPADLSTGGFALRLALFYAAIFLVIGIQMPFFPVWLEAKGLDAGAIGIVLAVPMVVRILAVPLATRAADHYHALRLGLIIVSAAAALGYAGLGFAQGETAIILVFALVSLAYTPAMPLTDAYALRGLTLRRQAYGPVRLWGSIAFVAGNIGAGFFLDYLPPESLIWLIAAALGLAIVAAIGLQPLPQAAAWPELPHMLAPLWRNRGFLFAASAASFVQASHAVYYGFSTLDWKLDGLDSVTIGSLWGVGVAAEILLFALQAPLSRVIGPHALLVTGALGAVIRWLAMAAAPPSWCLPLLQALHGLSFGATHLATLALVSQAVPARLGATAQGYLSIILGLVMAAAMGLAGFLYQRYGDLSYAAMALAACFGLAIALVDRKFSTA